MEGHNGNVMGAVWCLWVTDHDASGNHIIGWFGRKMCPNQCHSVCAIIFVSLTRDLRATYRMLLWVECFWEKARTRHLSPLDSTKGSTSSMRCPEFISRWRRTWCWSWSNKRRWWIGGRPRRFMSWRATTAPTSPPRLSSSTCSSKRHLPSRFRDLCLGNYQVLHFTLCDATFWLFATWL